MTSSASGVQGITEADIANYLANTPGFFERHAELLGSVQLTSPHGQRAVSLQERQMEMLRDKIRGLEGRTVEMLRHGQENVAIADRLHRWTCALMLTLRPAELPEVLVRELMHHFMIPQAGIRVWGAAPAFEGRGFAAPVSDDVKVFAASLALPYCGINSGFEAARWLEEPNAAKSMALVPLRAASFERSGDPLGDLSAPSTSSASSTSAISSIASPTFGLLVLASPDPTRYSAEMGTDFLSRIGEIAGAALARLLPAHD